MPFPCGVLHGATKGHQEQTGFQFYQEKEGPCITHPKKGQTLNANLDIMGEITADTEHPPPYITKKIAAGNK